MLYYNWILNIDDKTMHENTAEASEYMKIETAKLIDTSAEVLLGSNPESGYLFLTCSLLNDCQ
jgi:hypothetical protein